MAYSFSVDGDITLAGTTTDDDSTQYIEDPSAFRDDLPQPYRMINKLLELLLDHTWDAIVENRSHALKNAARKRPPQYDCATPLHDAGSVSCLAASFDDKFLYVATCLGGIACISACSNQVLAEWKPENVPSSDVSVTKICVDIIDEDMNLIITVENTGIVKVFLHVKTLILFAHSFLENQVETVQKQIVVDVTLSPAANYVGLVMESISDADSSTPNTCWVDIYHIPKETWLKEVESVFQFSSTPALSSSGNPVLINPAQAPAIAAIKFTPPSTVLKIRPPVTPTAINWTTPYQAFKSVEPSLADKGLGTGLFNVVSRHHLHARKMAYESLHQQHAPLIHSKEVHEMVHTQPVAFPTLHFLSPTALLCEQGEGTGTTGQQASMVAVWWSGSSHVLHYCLTRSAKDIEASQADIVWPMSFPVVSSAVTSCGSLFAVALTNNNVVIYDRRTGLIRRVAHVDDIGPLSNMYFHNMSTLCNSSIPQVENALIVEASGSGELYVIGCQFYDDSPPLPVYCQTENNDEIPVAVKPIPGISDLVIVCCQDGRLLIHDIMKQEQIAELILPAGYEYTASQPGVCGTVDFGRTLFVIASCMEQTTSGTNEDGSSGDAKSSHHLTPSMQVGRNSHKVDSHQSTNHNVDSHQSFNQTSVDGSTANVKSHLLAYKLTYFRTFDNYFKFCRKEEDEPVRLTTQQLTLQDKVNLALQTRTCAEAERLQRLHRRWFELKEQIVLSTN